MEEVRTQKLHSNSPFKLTGLCANAISSWVPLPVKPTIIVFPPRPARRARQSKFGLTDRHSFRHSCSRGSCCAVCIRHRGWVHLRLRHERSTDPARLNRSRLAVGSGMIELAGSIWVSLSFHPTTIRWRLLLLWCPRIFGSPSAQRCQARCVDGDGAHVNGR